MKLALLALIPAVAFAASPPSHARTSVLLIPMDQSAEASSLKMETWMEEALEQFPNAQVRRSDELFGLPADEEAEASLKRAEQGFAESSKSFHDGDPEDTERKLRATLKEFPHAAGAMKQCGHYCDAIALYAALMQKRGDTEEAKLALIDLLALEPTYELDAKKLGHDLLTLRSQVATSRSAALRGNAVIKTRPAGARVYVDGEFKGFAPLTVSTLPIGKHLLRIERPGFKRYGAVMEVTPDDVEVAAQLQPTQAWRSWDAQMDKVAQEAARGQGTTLTAVGKTLALDRAVIGTVKSAGDTGETEITVGVFDLKAGRRLATRRVVYQGDEYGQLRNEVGRLVNALLVSVDQPKEKASRSADPLDSASGMEDWSGEDRGGKVSKQKGNGDPLDGVNGTEDW